MQLQRILIVDDDADAAHGTAAALMRDGVHCELVDGGPAAIAACRQIEFDAAITDMRMAGMDGLELLAHLKSEQPELPVILITGQGSIASAVEAMKRGAFHYLTKPCSAAELRDAVQRAIHSRRRSGRTPSALAVTDTRALVGSSPAMRELRARIDLVAAATSPVLVLGETGTGKELVARAIHACSPRKSKPFVTVNASAIPESLLESQMFGHVRGAFTGATDNHRGLFAEANGGTLLLDEIGDMPLPLQAKLLRVLSDGTFRAVGADRDQRGDVRVIAATHRNLRELVRTGAFREDLYYRLNVVTVAVPPLRARLSDVPELATFFLARARERAPGSPARSLSPELLAMFGEARWAGNVRELESVIERLVVLARNEILTPDDLARSDGADIVGRHPLLSHESDENDPSLDKLIQRHVQRVLARTNGNKTRAAKLLGVDLSTLHRWQRKWNA